MFLNSFHSTNYSLHKIYSKKYFVQLVRFFPTKFSKLKKWNILCIRLIRTTPVINYTHFPRYEYNIAALYTIKKLNNRRCFLKRFLTVACADVCRVYLNDRCRDSTDILAGTSRQGKISFFRAIFVRRPNRSKDAITFRRIRKWYSVKRSWKFYCRWCQ